MQVYLLLRMKAKQVMYQSRNCQPDKYLNASKITVEVFILRLSDGYYFEQFN
jgi:hypothetical protein